MNKAQMLPTLLIVIDIVCASVYLADGDWRKVVYWTAAASLTFVVTF